MIVSPQKFRELVFQLLFCLDSSGDVSEAALEVTAKQVKVSIGDVERALVKANKVFSFRAQLDEVIDAASQTYDLSRVQKVELNVLRLGIYEMMYDESIPEKVAITEAVRLCRKFSTPESATYINAMLDGIWKGDEATE